MEVGFFTIFYYSDNEFEAGTPEKLECPVGLSELIFTLTVKDCQIYDGFNTNGDVRNFISNLWTNYIALGQHFNENIAAAKFSFSGYSYWVAMSHVFFEYAKKNKIVTVPNNFNYRSLSGFFAKDE